MSLFFCSRPFKCCQMSPCSPVVQQGMHLWIGPFIIGNSTTVPAAPDSLPCQTTFSETLKLCVATHPHLSPPMSAHGVSPDSGTSVGQLLVASWQKLESEGHHCPMIRHALCQGLPRTCYQKLHLQVEAGLILEGTCPSFLWVLAPERTFRREAGLMWYRPKPCLECRVCLIFPPYSFVCDQVSDQTWIFWQL
jgi:hypothetical protein